MLIIPAIQCHKVKKSHSWSKLKVPREQSSIKSYPLFSLPRNSIPCHIILSPVGYARPPGRLTARQGNRPLFSVTQRLTINHSRRTKEPYIPPYIRPTGLFSVTFGPLFIKINGRGNASPLGFPTDFRFRPLQLPGCTCYIHNIGPIFLYLSM